MRKFTLSSTNSVTSSEHLFLAINISDEYQGNKHLLKISLMMKPENVSFGWKGDITLVQ